MQTEKEILDGQMGLFDPDTWSGKTCPEHSAQIRERTSNPFSKKQSGSRNRTRPTFHYLQKESGLWLTPTTETDGPLPTEFSMHSFGESPSVAVESRLSQILEDTPHPKYSLSGRAAIGILRRANRRGKELPSELRIALENQSGLRSDTFGQAEIENAGEILRTLWQEAGEETFIEWAKRTYVLVFEKEILLCCLLKQDERGGIEEEADKFCFCKQGESEKCNSKCPVCYLWKSWVHGSTPQRRKSVEQLTGKLGAFVQELSRQTTPQEKYLLCLWIASERSQPMREALASVEEVKSAWMGYGLYENDKGENARVRWIKTADVAPVEETATGTGSGTYRANARGIDALPFDTTQITSPLNYSRPHYGDPCHPLAVGAHPPTVAIKERNGGTDYLTGWDNQEKRVFSAKGVSPTLSGSDGGGGRTVCGYIYYARGNEDGKTALQLYENHPADSRVTGPHDVCPTVSARYGTGGLNTPLVMATGQGGAEITRNISSTLNCNHEQPIVDHSLRAKANCAYREDMETYPVTDGIVRRLTPLECERLQGYPDGWTDIGPWTDSSGKLHKESSDSARYKALGNSIALPPWSWILKRLCACYERPATMASLFDGIGGFPLIWERLNGTGSCLWASEIEDFPIAVTKKHFGGNL